MPGPVLGTGDAANRRLSFQGDEYPPWTRFGFLYGEKPHPGSLSCCSFSSSSQIPPVFLAVSSSGQRLYLPHLTVPKAWHSPRGQVK